METWHSVALDNKTKNTIERCLKNKKQLFEIARIIGHNNHVSDELASDIVWSYVRKPMGPRVKAAAWRGAGWVWCR